MTATTDPSSSAIDIWPTRVLLLSRSQRRQVLDRLREQEERCPSCGGMTPKVDAPDAMQAFHDEADRYHVVVTCAAISCAGASWSVCLHAREFLHVRGRHPLDQ